MELTGINVLFMKEKKMKNSPKLKWAMIVFYAIMVGVILGYSWRMYHERIDTVKATYEYLNKEN